MKRLGALVVVAVVLNACTTAPPKPTVPPEQALWQQRSERLLQQSSWNLEGRVGVSSTHEAWSANIFWQQQDQGYQLRIVAPMGQGSAFLTGTPDYVILKSSRTQQPLVAQSAQQLLEQEFGWRVPVAELKYWVRGVPAPGDYQDISTNAEGLIDQLQQRGWKIDFKRYELVGAEQLPTKIFLSKEDVTVKLVVQSWDLRV